LASAGATDLTGPGFSARARRPVMADQLAGASAFAPASPTRSVDFGPMTLAEGAFWIRMFSEHKPYTMGKMFPKQRETNR
jgi:hypothetical protein